MGIDKILSSLFSYIEHLSCITHVIECLMFKKSNDIGRGSVMS